MKNRKAHQQNIEIKENRGVNGQLEKAGIQMGETWSGTHRGSEEQHKKYWGKSKETKSLPWAPKGST